VISPSDLVIAAADHAGLASLRFPVPTHCAPHGPLPPSGRKRGHPRRAAHCPRGRKTTKNEVDGNHGKWRNMSAPASIAGALVGSEAQQLLEARLSSSPSTPCTLEGARLFSSLLKCPDTNEWETPTDDAERRLFSSLVRQGAAPMHLEDCDACTPSYGRGCACVCVHGSVRTRFVRVRTHECA
jgi:hypothetical protein